MSKPFYRLDLVAYNEFGLCIDYDNVVYHRKNHSHQLDIFLYGGFTVSLVDEKCIDIFIQGYMSYLESKHFPEEVIVEIDGLDAL